MAAVVTNRSGPINLVRDVPKAVLVEMMFKYLPIQAIARFIGACRTTVNTFSDLPLRLRSHIRLLNTLRIFSPIAEHISLNVFRTRMLVEENKLVSNVVTFVEIKNLFLLRIALSSKKMTIELRVEAVMEAAFRGQLFALNILLANGEISDGHRGEAVFKAAQCGHLSCIQSLIAYGPISNGHRYSAVHCAVEEGHLSCIRELLKGLNERPGWLNCAIEAARESSKADIVALLKAWKPEKQKSSCIVS